MPFPHRSMRRAHASMPRSLTALRAPRFGSVPGTPTVLELRLARSFIAVAEEGHFARAAQRLHITQPALSRQIQQLERELGVRLLTRVGRAARLTVAGRTFLDHARRLLAMAEESALAARRASEE